MSEPLGVVCPFCSGADPKWPNRYAEMGKQNPFARDCLVSVKCLVCEAQWTRETRKWKRGKDEKK